MTQVMSAHTVTEKSKMPRGIEFAEIDGRRIFTLAQSSGALESFAIFLRYGDNEKIWTTFPPGLTHGPHRLGDLGLFVLAFPPTCSSEELTRFIESAAARLLKVMRA